MSEEIRTVLSKIERETLQIIRGMAPNSGSSVFVITPSGLVSANCVNSG